MAIEHENLVKLTLISLSQMPKTRAWANNTGTGRTLAGNRIIKYGLVGSSDILCISNGLFVCAEIKIGKDFQKPNQVKFQKMIEDCGGKYFIIRSTEDIETMKRML